MPAYLDRNGVQREIFIDPTAVERCRSRLGVNLYDLGQLGELSGDMMRFLRVIHCVSGYHVSNFDDWWKDHTGDAGDRCVSAFIDALCDFFPARLATMIRETNQAVARAVDEAWTKLEAEHAATYGDSPVAPAV